MGAPRFKPLRVRGTNAQRYARLNKACRRKASGRRRNALPNFGINYLALWLARRPKRPLLSTLVDVAVEYATNAAPVPDEILNALTTVAHTPYTDDGIKVVKRAVREALAKHYGSEALVPCA